MRLMDKVHNWMFGHCPSECYHKRFFERYNGVEFSSPELVREQEAIINDLQEQLTEYQRRFGPEDLLNTPPRER